jgi:GGDEF domain-containing protein
VAGQLRSLIENHDFECVKLTASFGVAAFDFSEKEHLTRDAIIKRADDALLIAKSSGRNQIFAWNEQLGKN